jgi:hypothetical protein
MDFQTVLLGSMSLISFILLWQLSDVGTFRPELYRPPSGAPIVGENEAEFTDEFRSFWKQRVLDLEEKRRLPCEAEFTDEFISFWKQRVLDLEEKET